MNEEKPVELVCGLNTSRCGGDVRKYYRTNCHSGHVSSTQLRCERCVEYYSLNSEGKRLDEVYNETVVVLAAEYSKAIDAQANAAMIERDGNCRVPCRSLGENLYNPLWYEEYEKEKAQSEAISRAWNRSNKLPRVVNFDPYIPRGE